MSKFIEKSIQKQDEAYNLKYAEKEFAFSCHLCATRGILHRDCVTCPVNVAHCRAVAEIRSGQRETLKKSRYSDGTKLYRDRCGHITLTLQDISNADVNISININGKEVK